MNRQPDNGVAKIQKGRTREKRWERHRQTGMGERRRDTESVRLIDPRTETEGRRCTNLRRERRQRDRTDREAPKGNNQADGASLFSLPALPPPQSRKLWGPRAKDAWGDGVWAEPLRKGNQPL